VAGRETKTGGDGGGAASAVAGRAEAAAVGVPHPIKGEAVWCLVVPTPGTERSGALASELAGLVADHLGKAFRPERVAFVDELPKTRSAKILRRAIRAVVTGQDPGDLSSLENPTALEAIRRLRAGDTETSG